MAECEEDAAVGFIFKAMQQRDPSKRRLKPVAKELMQLDFAGLDDSEDDSDFEISKEKEDSDNSNVDSNNDDSDSGSSNSQSNTETDNEGSDDNETCVADSSSKDLPLSELLENAQNEKTNYDSKLISEHKVTSTSNLKLMICCVCLEDRSDSVNEVVECDSCGVTVHEGCYGITDNDSVASSESSTSTEPWFCDSCKAGVKPHCELCPYTGGIFKETDAGKWVHTVCALYTPGITFEDTEKLSNCTLFEMQYTRWGAKECSLCEDGRYSWTGVVIGCDAGLCRNYFHVTCAQRDGLLAEAISNDDEEVVDPFFAHCKQHADKNSTKVKRRNWLALHNSMKYKQTENLHMLSERMQRKLNRHRKRYIASHLKVFPEWAPTEKVPRLLSTCPEALKALLKKAELLGINDQAETQLNDVRRKWNIAPALSTEFVLYYFERNKRIDSMKDSLRELLLNRENLKIENEGNRKKYNELLEEINSLKESSEKMKELGFQIIKHLQKVSKKTLNYPEVFNISEKFVQQDVNSSDSILINKCAECKSSKDAHLLIQCDSCKKYYHLGCLDPPLSRVPRQTKRYKWECSNCSPNSSDSEVTIEDGDNVPRRLRRQLSEPSKLSLYTSQKEKKVKNNESNIIEVESKNDTSSNPVVLLCDITSQNQNMSIISSNVRSSHEKYSSPNNLSNDQCHQKLVKTILRILDNSLKNKKQIVEMVVKSISTDEKFNYSTSLEHWYEFCEGKLASYKPTSKLLLEFLKELQSKDIAANEIVTCKSAVLLIARIMGIYKLDNDYTIKKFIENLLTSQADSDGHNLGLPLGRDREYGRGKRRRTKSLHSVPISPPSSKKSSPSKKDTPENNLESTARKLCGFCSSPYNMQKSLRCFSCSNYFHNKCIPENHQNVFKDKKFKPRLCIDCNSKRRNNVDDKSHPQASIEFDGDDDFGIIDGTVDEDCPIDLFNDDADSESTTTLIDYEIIE